MLDTINWAEGGPNFDELYNYVPFNNYGPHPNKKITAGGYTSTAAGAYQILYSTWQYAIKALGIPDYMSPENQMQVALFLIDQRNALGDIDSGNIYMAIQKISWEWASLPVVYSETVNGIYYKAGSGRYGQHVQSIDSIIDTYNLLIDDNVEVAGIGLLGTVLIIGLSIGMLRKHKKLP